MTHLIVTDLAKDKALDTEAMLSVKGGFAGYLPLPYEPWYGPINLVSKDLTNHNTQLNIAVGSAGLVQTNSNNAIQGSPFPFIV